MGYKLNPKEETMVLMAIKELKQATPEEIQDCIKEKWDTEINTTKLHRYIGRWNKGKAIAANLIETEEGKKWAYSLRDIPWYPEAQMIHILKPEITETEAKSFLENYKKELKERGYVATREPDIRDYKFYQVTMEIIDSIAGGMGTGGDEKILKFPCMNGEPIIPRNWITGLFRENARMINMTPSIKFYVAASTGKFIGKPKLELITVQGKKGPQTHEVIGPGNKFQLKLGFPMHGTPIKTTKQLESFFKMIEEAPIRGLGAYNEAFGGRVGTTLKEIK